MSELQPIVPREENTDGGLALQQDTPEPVPITEQEVGEYREQDRFLPVSNAHRIMTLKSFDVLSRGRLPTLPES